MLRAALQSVAAQSRMDLIHDVVVIENGGDRRSDEICRTFGDLPVRYLFRDEPVSAELNIVGAAEMSRCGLVAMLGDDDMWSRYHLEEAVRLLESNRDAVAYAGQAVRVKNGSRQVTDGYTKTFHAFAWNEEDDLADRLIWSAKEVLMESVIHTPLNLWAIVARRDQLLDAMSILREPEPGRDSDRFLWWRLSLKGPIVVGREVGLFYRDHASSQSVRMSKSRGQFYHQRSCAYIRQMVETAEAEGIEWRDEWCDMWNAMPENVRQIVWRGAKPSARQCLREMFGHRCPFPSDARWPRGAVWLRPFVPPIVAQFARRILLRKSRRMGISGGNEPRDDGEVARSG